jgi:AAA domain, putative AbiEii toxin, Type IV TA system
MLKSLRLRNVALAPDLEVLWAPRFNLLVGDNGLGKSFLLDVAWWALTRTWVGAVALPGESLKPTIAYRLGEFGDKPDHAFLSEFDRSDETWRIPRLRRPSISGIVVYLRVDGGFSVWDVARNAWRRDSGRASAYHFNSEQVWNGLDVEGRRVCEGLERDWVSWQEGNKPQFRALEAVLRQLSPANEQIRPGPARRLFLGEGRDRPTLLFGSQNVPLALASAGVRRILTLAYFLVWAWHEHRVAARLLGKGPTDRFVILFDEPETHLHPRWQRTLLPSLLAAVQELTAGGPAPQLLVASHSPLVAASLEPYFDREVDDLIHLELREGQVVVQQGGWAAQGDATNWLVSEAFGLDQARSLEAEGAIEAAEAWMRGERARGNGLGSTEAIHAALQQLLPAHDPFWPRWLVETGQVGSKGGA